MMCSCKDCNDVDRIPLRDIDGLLTGNRLSIKQMEKVFWRVWTLHRNHDVLTDAELVALEGLCDRLTGILCPSTVEECDEEAAERDARFPGLRHFYKRSGPRVVWWDKLVDYPAEGDAAHSDARNEPA
ncbi:MAG: hypothetical protein JO345_22975 [Streptosporangiaceae bacterium]|nr:hypothetical protein [Streptosporangiaceae bacterium]